VPRSYEVIGIAFSVVDAAKELGFQTDLEKVLKRFGDFTLLRHKSRPEALAASMQTEAEEDKRKRERKKEAREAGQVTSRAARDRTVPPGIHPQEWTPLNQLPYRPKPRRPNPRSSDENH
jgi:hypothetical protein